jgi:EAL domain-containing protein (putative c-di-GMP-specific phosphodiesterase class I)
VLDRWVVERALALLAPHSALLAKRSVGFAINLSGQSIDDDSFADFLIEKLEHCGLEPALFSFELTENAAISSIGRAEVLMRRLRRLGCGVALDDFGTGLSSLSYLRQLPVTSLKMDGSFVRDVLKDGRAESMVQAIAQLARSMSIQTVAKYVETEELRHRVAALGVDHGQGFAIGRPLPLQEMLVELPLLAAAAPVAVAVEEPPLEIQAAQAAANLH